MKRISVFFIPLLLLSACHKDSVEILTDIDYPDPPEVLVTTRLVTVLDNAPSNTAQVLLTFAGQTTGFEDFNFNQMKGAGIKRDFEILHLTTASDLHFFKVNSLTENDVNYTHIQLPEVQSYSGETSTSSNYTFSSGAALTIPAGSLAYADGTAFQGTYTLTLATLTASGIEPVGLPSFCGINTHHERVSLHFESGYYLSAQTGDGEALTFGEDVFLSLPEKTTPGWFFDAEEGAWVLLSGTDQVGQKQIHPGASGYYACAAASPLIRVKGTLRINGSLTPHYPISFNYGGQQHEIYTTNAGSWSIQLPAQTACLATINIPCADAQQILLETSSAKEMEASFTITENGIENVQLLGTARDCNYAPLNDHFTIIEGDAHTILFAEEPGLNFNVPVCKNGSVLISTFNPASRQSGPSINWEAADTIDIHSTFACNQARNEYLALSVSDEKKMYWDLRSQVEGDRLIILTNEPEPDVDFQVFVEGLAKGSYADNMLNILFEDRHLGTKGYSLYCPTATSGCGFTDFTITHFAEEEGQWIRGYFKGKFWIKTFNPLTAGYRPVEGEFQVFREF